MLDYARVPNPAMADDVRRYVEDGVMPGSFLRALFANNLKESFARADKTNAALMHDWVRFMANELPSECWGSDRAVMRWTWDGGLNGRRRVDAGARA